MEQRDRENRRENRERGREKSFHVISMQGTALNETEQNRTERFQGEWRRKVLDEQDVTWHDAA